MIDRNPSTSDRQFLKDIHSIAESLKIIVNLMAADAARNTPRDESKTIDEIELANRIIERFAGGDDRK